MELLDGLMLGLGVAVSPTSLLLCLLGVTLGTLVGVLPGIGPAATGVGLEHGVEGVVLGGMGLAVDLGQLGAQRRHRRGERRILARKAGRADIAFRLIDLARRQAGNFAPEAHFAMACLTTAASA